MTSIKSSVLIDKEDEGQRLDHILLKKCEGKSRNYIHYLFKEGMISTDGKSLKKSAQCKEGQKIDIKFIDLPEVKLRSEDIPLEILFEDEHLIICNKPTGMVTHPAPGSLDNTFAGALLHYLKNLPESDDPLRPGIVHRLDKETSGVIVAAKTTAALTALQKMFAERKMKKTYTAICHGTPNADFVNAPIGRHPKNRKAMAVKEDGKEALTDVEVLGKGKGFSLVLAKPHTGRTHQIRVHLKHLNSPIIGDSLYGPKNVKTKRCFLHASHIEFIHPFTHQLVSVGSSLPRDMEVFTKNEMEI